MGRRVEKKVFNYVAGDWQLMTDSLFLYDDWNLISESTTITGQGSPVVKYYVWGLDLSQTLQGAGGIGGLLTTVNNGETYHYFYDGNGNVTQLMKASDGSIAAHYEYDPYGNIIVESGSLAKENPFCYSTKYKDHETNLLYFGYRYYSPELGRWISRDPSGEMGGLNLYKFLDNDPINLFDALGLASLTAVKNGTLVFTWNMGWIDKTHSGYKTKSPQLVSAWEKLKKAKVGDAVSITLDFHQSGGRGVKKCYCIIASGVNLADRAGQFLWAYMDASEAFESEQERFPQNIGWINKIYGWLVTGEKDKIPSGFSSEDLVSDLVQFYSIVDGRSAETLLNKYAGRIPSRELDFSISVWEQLHKVSPGYRKWTPDIPYEGINNVINSWELEAGFGKQEQYNLQFYLILYQNRFGPPKFPDFFQRFSPQPQGISTTSCGG